MNGFISFKDQIKNFLNKTVLSEERHTKWLNTLSFLENCGARKIAACEHPTLVKEEMLKHAAEEFRHAHYLKRQLERISSNKIPDYSASSILGGSYTLHYLSLLDMQTCRYLKTMGFTGPAIKEAAYLLVTYAIELRAGEIYPIYEEILRKTESRVTVKSILLEEEEHLKEMEAGLKLLPSGFLHAKNICQLEGALCKNWLQVLETIAASR